MKVYVFGNSNVKGDNLAFKIVKRFRGKINNLKFLNINPNEDLPFTEEKSVVILDTIQGIDQVDMFTDIENFILSPRNSVHDFDLGFQLKYLQKLGKLGKLTIIGLPQTKEIDYERIQSILRKLVAQDMQGS